MSSLVPPCALELMLLDGGEVLLTAHAAEATPRVLVLVARTPTRLIDAAANWLARYERAEITVVVRDADELLLSWTTRSPSSALYFIATALGASTAVSARRTSKPPANRDEAERQYRH